MVMLLWNSTLNIDILLLAALDEFAELEKIIRKKTNRDFGKPMNQQKCAVVTIQTKKLS